MKVKGQTVQTGECPQTNGQTDAIKRIIAPATRLIKISKKKSKLQEAKRSKYKVNKHRDNL